MDLLHEPVWRRFWYPVAFAEDLDAGPVARTVLGESVVLWSSDGSVAAAIDRCPHRDAPLSAGWVCDGQIVCPYHGWQYGRDGAATHIPQTPALLSFPRRFTLTPVRSALRCGAVWVCLDEPIMDIPDLPDPERPGWRWIREFDEEWDTPAARLMENSLDPAHTMFVHRATFGDQQGAAIETPVVERTHDGLSMRSEISVKNPDAFRQTTGEITDKTTRSTVTGLHGPFLRMMTVTYPSGRHHQIVTAATPVDNGRLRLVQWASRDDTEEECAADTAVAFDRRVTLEDKALLEAIRVPYDAAVDANIHIRVDRPTVALRHLYAAISAGTWPARLEPSATPAPSATRSSIAATTEPQAAVTTASETVTVPVIDISAFISGDDLETAPRLIGHAAATSGFFQIVGHGIPTGFLDDAYEVAVALSELPSEVKETLRPRSGHPYRGLMSNYDHQGRLVSEGFTIARFDGFDDAVANGIAPELADYFPDNVWPSIPGFRAAMTALLEQTRRLGATLMRIFAVALDQPIDYFDPYCVQDTARATIRSYPARRQLLEVDPTVIFDEHFDGGMLTLLHQRGTYEGLQVRTLNGEWFPVPVREEGFVVNMGELMTQWTNGRWPATMHRVVASADPDGCRFTLPTFYAVAVDTVIAPLPGTVGENGGNFEPVRVYDWERRHLIASYNRRKHTTATPAAETYVAALARE
jgi:isopenicillin N synthase-like dioxygenase/phenylpropionate dioxygenase-like ring-hydroxylating dioxygenase large terminal subunit